jgi:hypothetical protein
MYVVEEIVTPQIENTSTPPVIEMTITSLHEGDPLIIHKLLTPPVDDSTVPSAQDERHHTAENARPTVKDVMITHEFTGHDEDFPMSDDQW